jgi:hypothetical protein
MESSLVRTGMVLLVVAALAGVRAASGFAGPVPSCKQAFLAASFGGEAATQSLLGTATVANLGSTPCLLSGRPAIALRGGPPEEVLAEQAMDTATEFPGTRFYAQLLLRPGAAASVRFQWTNWCNPQANGSPGAADLRGSRPSRVRMTIGSDTRGLVASVSGGLSTLYLPVCVNPAQPSVLYVSLWTPGP